mmetsp:Transcript_41429/g.123780  ORF Transcript_41429/g.123780 Transcript_41429/m.123780 type:complete len:203 (+) Transcript_41429:815-1423(+)
MTPRQPRPRWRRLHPHPVMPQPPLQRPSPQLTCPRRLPRKRRRLLRRLSPRQVRQHCPPPQPARKHRLPPPQLLSLPQQSLLPSQPSLRWSPHHPRRRRYRFRPPRHPQIHRPRCWQRCASPPPPPPPPPCPLRQRCGRRRWRHRRHRCWPAALVVEAPGVRRPQHPTLLPCVGTSPQPAPVLRMGTCSQRALVPQVGTCSQ